MKTNYTHVVCRLPSAEISFHSNERL